MKYISSRFITKSRTTTAYIGNADVRKRSVSNNIIIYFLRIITLQLINFFYSLYSGKYKCIRYVFCPRNQISFLLSLFFSLSFSSRAKKLIFLKKVMIQGI